MQKTIEQLYDGELFSNEQLNAQIAGYMMAQMVADEVVQSGD